MAVRVNLNNAAINAEIMRRGGRVDRDVRKRAQRVERRAKTLAPTRTGRLRRSIKLEKNRKANGAFDFGYSITADAPHAGWVHDGTAAHTVTRRRKKILTDRVNFFGKEVFIPAQRARPFLEEALDAALED